ncbi:MAG TPA: hypothetical protein VFC82_03520 [Actinomycetaceae bacterium]|nr:hypothetical protein [Actinomycetaceae bacterium]
MIRIAVGQPERETPHAARRAARRTPPAVANGSTRVPVPYP